MTSQQKKSFAKALTCRCVVTPSYSSQYMMASTRRQPTTNPSLHLAASRVQGRARGGLQRLGRRRGRGPSGRRPRLPRWLWRRAATSSSRRRCGPTTITCRRPATSPSSHLAAGRVRGRATGGVNGSDGGVCAGRAGAEGGYLAWLWRRAATSSSRRGCGPTTSSRRRPRTIPSSHLAASRVQGQATGGVQRLGRWHGRGPSGLGPRLPC